MKSILPEFRVTDVEHQLLHGRGLGIVAGRRSLGESERRRKISHSFHPFPTRRKRITIELKAK